MKRKNWMLTIWGNEFPSFLTQLEDVNIIHLQLETTATNKINHWQTFIQFEKQISKATIKTFFDKHKRKCHIGQKPGSPDIKTVLQGIQYVSGYGQLALKKCLNMEERYIIRNNKVCKCVFDENYIELYHRLHGANFHDELIQKNLDLSERLRDEIKKRGIIIEW